MRRKSIYKITSFLLFLIATVIFTLTACDGKGLRVKQDEINSTSNQKSSSSLVQETAATKTISHALGQVEIPRHPQRIVVLDANAAFLLDSLLALEIKPVGLTRCSDCISLEPFSEFLDDIPTVGSHEQPSLEKIISLKPDLILGYDWQKSFYPQLSAIAPTVMIDIFSDGNDFKRHFRYLAKILDKSNQAERILAEYDEKVQNFRQQLGEKLKTKTVSLLSFFDSTVHVYGPETLSYAQVMLDAGIQFIPAYKNLKDDYLRLSLENISDWDADFLFVEFYYKEEFENLNSLSFFKAPIWLTLRAVQNEQVYIMTWTGGGPMMADRVIDDLYEYFSEAL